MITAAAVVALISSLGWLFLNWKAYKADVRSAGWSGSTQIKMGVIWVAIIAALSLVFSLFLS